MFNLARLYELFNTKVSWVARMRVSNEVYTKTGHLNEYVTYFIAFLQVCVSQSSRH